jgi:CBS-domain-containing membrane protein
MKKVADHCLDSMIGSLREHLDRAKQMGLTLTAQLLNMALIELKTELHGISPDDIEALCRRMEEQASARVMPQTAKVIPFPGHTGLRKEIP